MSALAVRAVLRQQASGVQVGSSSVCLLQKAGRAKRQRYFQDPSTADKRRRVDEDSGDGAGLEMYDDDSSDDGAGGAPVADDDAADLASLPDIIML